MYLNLSKHLIYNFYYNNLKKKYGDKCNLLYTDRDSLILEIKTEDKDKDNYDFSNYPVNHPLYSDEKKKRLGKFKDETC